MTAGVADAEARSRMKPPANAGDLLRDQAAAIADRHGVGA